MGAHAKLSASGAKRWMNCPGSIRMAEELLARGIEPGSSEFARLGTAAHGLGEQCLRTGEQSRDWIGGVVYLDDDEDCLLIRPDPDMAGLALGVECEERGFTGYPIDDEMADAVNVYLETVRDDLAEGGPHAELSVERRFDLSHLHPNMFGTNDASVTLPFDWVKVHDYKHGQGVAVEVEENVQELYYALGVAYSIDWAFENVELVIVQPRCPHPDGAVRRWSTTKDYLREFEKELIAAAKRTEEPDAPLCAGEWCQFCPAAPYCPELKEKAFATALVDFGEPGVSIELTTYVAAPETTDEDLRARLDAIPLLDAFYKAVETEAMRRLRESPTGEAFGYKLVRKKSNRAFRKDLTIEVDGEELPLSIKDALLAEGFPEADLYEEPKMKGPAKIEKLRPPAMMAELKKQGCKAPAREIAAIISRYTYKPEGGITAVPESDPRPAVDPSAAALSDFDSIDPEQEDS